MEKRVSLKDIAQRVGVSIALVSYVLNKKKEGRISKEVSEKIRAAAEKMNYRPNQVAKSLKTNKTFTIGLVVADISNPFFSILARIIEDEAEKNNYTVIFGSSDEKAERSEKLVNVLIDRQVDGMIIAPAEGTEKQMKQLQKAGFPFVLIDRHFPNLDANYIGIDNYTAALEATTHLINTGKKRIGMLGFNTSLRNLEDRKRGFLQAFANANRAPLTNGIEELPLDVSQKEVEAAIKRLLSLPEPVDALFFASNKLSTFGLKYLNTLPIKVPQDLALCSFDESDATELFHASLTHVRQPLHQMGQDALNRLLQIIGGDKNVLQIQLATELVFGQSS